MSNWAISSNILLYQAFCSLSGSFILNNYNNEKGDMPAKIKIKTIIFMDDLLTHNTKDKNHDE